MKLLTSQMPVQHSLENNALQYLLLLLFIIIYYFGDNYFELVLLVVNYLCDK